MPRRRGKANPSQVGGGLLPHLRPSKVCPVCQRPFSWRRRWRTVWDEVIYCSDRCRRQKDSRPQS